MGLLDAIVTVLIIFGGFIVLRAMFNYIRFCFKLLSLSRQLKKLNGGDIRVEYVRKFSAIAFGEKGKPNFFVKTKEKSYEVAVLAFPVVRGRWNIEKAEDRYFAEVRAYNNMFFNVYYNSGTEPEHSKDYRRETRVARKRLYINPEKGEGEKILLIYPKPKALTYTDFKLGYINSGDSLFGYKVLYDEDFFALFKK
ncbi:MAG: hypothetical protein E7597_06460 [Ruminococcaceae bacterium]|nr:hypothetical protein [Oscillospiraceae bacterium]